MQRQQGFTLIELIAVIVILGILGVVAAPKFMGVSSDARVATLNGVKAAIQSANAQIYAKSILKGEENLASGSVNVEGSTDVDTVYGYLSALTADDAATDMSNVLEGNIEVLSNGNTVADDQDWGVYQYTNGGLRIFPQGFATGQACYLQYIDAANATTAPTYTITDTAC